MYKIFTDYFFSGNYVPTRIIRILESRLADVYDNSTAAAVSDVDVVSVNGMVCNSNTCTAISSWYYAPVSTWRCMNKDSRGVSSTSPCSLH